MSERLKVGDKVEIIRTSYIGDVGIIEKANENIMGKEYFVNMGSKKIWFPDDKLRKLNRFKIVVPDIMSFYSLVEETNEDESQFKALEKAINSYKQSLMNRYDNAVKALELVRTGKVPSGYEIQEVTGEVQL